MQVLTLQIRSRVPAGTALPPVEQELDYPRILNSALPNDIQITGWQPAADDFHARFSCIHREYKYFIAGVHSRQWLGTWYCMVFEAHTGVHVADTLCIACMPVARR